MIEFGMASASKATVVYIQDNQSSAGTSYLKLVSQNKNSEFQTLLQVHESVYHLAEILTIIQSKQANKLLNSHQLMELNQEYPRPDISYVVYLKRKYLNSYLTIILMNLESGRIRQARSQDNPKSRGPKVQTLTKTLDSLGRLGQEK
jgi:hypothetical protein